MARAWKFFWKYFGILSPVWNYPPFFFIVIIFCGVYIFHYYTHPPALSFSSMVRVFIHVSYKYIIHIAAQQRRSCQTCTSCESWMKVVWEVLCLSFVCLCCCYWWKEGRRTEKAYSFRDHQTFQPTSFFNLSVLPFSLNCVSSPPTVVLYSSSPRIKLWALLLVGDP